MSEVQTPCGCRLLVNFDRGERRMACSCPHVWKVRSTTRYVVEYTTIGPADLTEAGALKLPPMETYETPEHRVVCSVHHCQPGECFDLHHAEKVTA